MELSFTPVPYRAEYETRLLGFLERCLPESGRVLDLSGRHSFYLHIADSFAAFWCMFDREQIIGTVAVREMNAQDCELKSLYLLEKYHGNGYGRALLETALQYAAQAGFRTMYLDSLSTSAEALRLYRKAGFTDTAPYHESVRADVFMMRPLTNRQEGRSMKIRPYIHEQDFSLLRTWSTDARTHAMWCADRFPYPPEPAGFAEALRSIREQWGDAPYIAADENGSAVGFFCRPGQPHQGEIMLKFVIVDPALRGQGIGTKMLRAAVQDIFAQTDADAVQLMVFAENPAARKCYRKAGFTERALTPAAFRFQNESWGRCNMVIRREDTE
ncbi:MAG: GNAT family N-acetyltransferase [Oscillospiraceae bacterium]|nr:GNAT family N-acetyltransferase [Oscillospiraceae bacterium]